jgi:hypothetical protein
VIRIGYCSYINTPTQALEYDSEHYNYFRPRCQQSQIGTII